MVIISTLRKMHENTIGYSYDEFIEYVKKLQVKNLLITYTSRKNFEEHKSGYQEITLLEQFFNVEFPEINYKKYDKLLKGTLSEVHNAEEVTKKNIVDIIETVINSYLKGYWKDPETVNSEVTDSIFRVNNKFIQSVEPDYIEKYWLPLHTEIYNYIIEDKKDYDAIISDVENTFFYKDKKIY
ncbi:hypothetical protein [Ferroplasma sp.]|uniref:hypothetical protein n=1 Tax=Ferroplasma sp. TaxID=2591003 RepID=UPI00307D86AE